MLSTRSALMPSTPKNHGDNNLWCCSCEAKIEKSWCFKTVMFPLTPLRTVDACHSITDFLQRVWYMLRITWATEWKKPETCTTRSLTLRTLCSRKEGPQTKAEAGILWLTCSREVKATYRAAPFYRITVQSWSYRGCEVVQDVCTSAHQSPRCENGPAVPAHRYAVRVQYSGGCRLALQIPSTSADVCCSFHT